ncbi:hypothetical protein Pmani_002658 [Petrolisthes manimaculis]|uniref:Uncharacterized protein n=1 Tax=Petrolisthes manimaculis TaxID=1843537 RepID=A0AAE1QI53_9EUCA|nr:hypothetical protein Pmani_002658 [Petrolisthes manimaculis]
MKYNSHHCWSTQSLTTVYYPSSPLRTIIMASTVSRAASRLVKSCLVRPHVHTLPTRTVISFRGVTQPWTVASPDAVEIQEEPKNRHMEMMSVWYDESERLAQSRLTHPDMTPEDLQRQNGLFREQLVDLLDHLHDEQVMDIRQGWMGTQ